MHQFSSGPQFDKCYFWKYFYIWNQSRLILSLPFSVNTCKKMRISLLRFQLFLETKAGFWNSIKLSTVCVKVQELWEITNQEYEIMWNESDPTGPMLICWREINLYFSCGLFDLLVKKWVRYLWYSKTSDQFWSIFRRINSYCRLFWSHDGTLWWDRDVWTKSNMFGWLNHWIFRIGFRD